jgi:hypothetical protein
VLNQNLAAQIQNSGLFREKKKEKEFFSRSGRPEESQSDEQDYRPRQPSPPRKRKGYSPSNHSNERSWAKEDEPRQTRGFSKRSS